MSYRDRKGQSPSLYDSNRRPERDQSSQSSSGAAPHGREQDEARPWHVDPAEVDRYLAEREQAIRLERPDNFQRDRQAPNPRQTNDRTSSRSPAADYSLRSSRNQPLPEPSDLQWPDLDDDQWPAVGDDPFPDSYEPSREPAPAPAPRPPRSRRRPATLRAPARSRQARTLPQVRVPRFVSSAALVSDRTSLMLLAATAFSIVVMWAVFGSRISHAGPVVALHLDAVGVPDRWGPAKSLWRLPLLATMVPLMNLVIAWAIARFDQFASRFLLATGLCLQLLVWIAAIRFLW